MQETLVDQLMAGDEDAIRRILLIVHATSRDSFSRRGSRINIDISELASVALLDAFAGISGGVIQEDAELLQGLKRSVWREIKRQQRHSARQAGDSEYETAVAQLAVPPVQLSALSDDLSVDLDVLYQETKSTSEEAQARVDLVAVDTELIEYLTRHPEQMYTMMPRRFEELIAAVLADLGYQVELTGFGADGGVDIIATQKSTVGDTLLLVDCKRYAPDRPVGVSIVRALFGSTEQRRATSGLLATTSYFTAPALEFRSAVRHRLMLKKFEDLQRWLSGYGKCGRRK
jgi:restriction endonuclease Mrr